MNNFKKIVLSAMAVATLVLPLAQAASACGPYPSSRLNQRQESRLPNRGHVVVENGKRFLVVQPSARFPKGAKLEIKSGRFDVRDGKIFLDEFLNGPLTAGTEISFRNHFFIDGSANWRVTSYPEGSGPIVIKATDGGGDWTLLR